MIAMELTNIKDFMTKLLLTDTFDDFSFIEGEIVTYNTFHIDGFLQQNFFDTAEKLPEYSTWKKLREFCFSVIKGEKSPLSFKVILALPPASIPSFLTENTLPQSPQEIGGLYINLHFDGKRLFGTTGISQKSFSLDKSLEKAWDQAVCHFLDQQGITWSKAT